jgi:hypothetical protein
MPDMRTGVSSLDTPVQEDGAPGKGSLSTPLSILGGGIYGVAETRDAGDWFPWLASAGAAERSEISIDEGGLSLWWSRLDDGLSVPRLFGLPEWP